MPRYRVLRKFATVSSQPKLSSTRFRIRWQTVSILHQRVPGKGEARWLAWCFARQLRLGIRLGFVRLVAAFLSSGIHTRIARIVGRGFCLPAPLRWKLFIEA